MEDRGGGGWRQASRAGLFHWSIYQWKWHINKHISPEVRGSNRDEYGCQRWTASSGPPPPPITQKTHLILHTCPHRRQTEPRLNFSWLNVQINVPWHHTVMSVVRNLQSRDIPGETSVNVFLFCRFVTSSFKFHMSLDEDVSPPPRVSRHRPLNR